MCAAWRWITLVLCLARSRPRRRRRRASRRHPDRRQRIAQRVRRHRHEVDLPVVRLLGVGLELLRALRGADQLAVGFEQLAQARLVLGERRCRRAGSPAASASEASVVAGVGAAVSCRTRSRPGRASWPGTSRRRHGGSASPHRRRRRDRWLMPMLADSESVCGPIARRRGQRRRGSCAAIGAASARARHLGEQDHELVAAVRLTESDSRTPTPCDAARRELQHLVADRVAEGVVDLLEAVEVEEQDADPRRAPLRHRDRRSASRSSISARVGAPVSSSCWVERASSSRLLTAVCAAVSACTAAWTSSVVDLEQLRGAQAAQLLLAPWRARGAGWPGRRAPRRPGR